MSVTKYAVRLEPSDDGGFVVTCRDLPELITQGEDVRDATTSATYALTEVVAAYNAMGKELPAPTEPLVNEYLIELM